MTTRTPQRDDAEAALAQLFAPRPDDPATALDWCQAVERKFRQVLANAVQPMLQAHLERQTPASFADFQAVASRTNKLLSGLGLCMHVDGKPAVLTADRTAYGNVARYAVRVLGTHHSRVDSVSVPAPDLQVRPTSDEDTLRIAQWQRRANADHGR